MQEIQSGETKWLAVSAGGDEDQVIQYPGAVYSRYNLWAAASPQTGILLLLLFHQIV